MSALTCGACGTGNPADARFCMNCGARLERRCPVGTLGSRPKSGGG
jgi:hypothetical protein